MYCPILNMTLKRYIYYKLISSSIFDHILFLKKAVKNLKYAN